jgi:ubiquitin
MSLFVTFELVNDEGKKYKLDDPHCCINNYKVFQVPRLCLHNRAPNVAESEQDSIHERKKLVRWRKITKISAVVDRRCNDSPQRSGTTEKVLV